MQRKLTIVNYDEFVYLFCSYITLTNFMKIVPVDRFESIICHIFHPLDKSNFLFQNHFVETKFLAYVLMLQVWIWKWCNESYVESYLFWICSLHSSSVSNSTFETVRNGTLGKYCETTVPGIYFSSIQEVLPMRLVLSQSLRLHF